MTVINSKPSVHSSLIADEIQGYSHLYSQEDINIFTETLSSGNGLVYNCANDAVGTLFIENVTEYDYYTAAYDGITSSNGYKDLFGIDNSSFQLKYEPSWQLYSTKSYSPQLPEAFTEKRHYYYHDLKNRYDRFSKDLYPNNENLSENLFFKSSKENYDYVLFYHGYTVGTAWDMKAS